MKIKRAIRYLRISTDRQSNFSIDGQGMQTEQWCERNNVDIIDTFIDEGYSARNFDRPDMNRLNEFLQKHYRTVDYLVVNDFTRFSRDTGEALVAIKNLQKKFAVKLVSVNEGITFDADDPGSFFYAGLMLLKGEDEIIRNRGRINMGIYTGKKKEGRYLNKAPFGYLNRRDAANKPIIVVDKDNVHIIKFIFSAFLNNVPINEIYKHISNIGFAKKGHSAIINILKNPVYTGLIHVNAYKENLEEMVEGIHEAIISRTIWNEVQDKLKGRDKPVQIINDEMPLRSVLLCHCGKPLTGAPSKGKLGGIYYYYKCQRSEHNNISVKKAHSQLLDVLSYMSLTERLILGLRNKSEELLEQRFKDDGKLLRQKQNELKEIEAKLVSIEEKWINNQMPFEAYQRWYPDLTKKRMVLRAQKDELSQDQQAPWLLLQKELKKLEDLKILYQSSSTLQKQQLIRLVFDSRLYYEDNIYRTPYIMPIFSHNTLILKEKQLLVLNEKTGLSQKVPQGRAYGTTTYFNSLYLNI